MTGRIDSERAVQPMAVQDIVFIHQNMPGQFRHLAMALAKQKDRFRVFFITCRKGVDMAGIETLRYERPQPKERSSEPFARSFEAAAGFGRAVAGVALDLARKGVRPALVLYHPGWGEGLFLRDIWPGARLLSYAEYYYQPRGGDIGFDPIFPVTPAGLFNSRAMNANLLLAHEQADVLLSPTHWQKSRHPAILRGKTAVIFDGIDTNRAKPDPKAGFKLPDGRVLTRKFEVITYVARNLEPHRGYHVFMQALPKLLAVRPHATVLIVGGSDVSYSPRPRDGHADWRAKFAAEIDLGADGARVHHLGKLPYSDYMALLQISSAHVYLTYPFVLSWSCLEAMAAGCMLVASDTAPVREVIRHEENGLLVPFFDGDQLVAAVCRALDDKALAQRLRKAARETVVARYELQNCVKQQLALVEQLLAPPPPRPAPAPAPVVA
ncbi:glycosyltransferase [Novosphingobium sediminicola]|uniref:Glycosyltransferase involved in cell wall biosynthesis n=1 Tax=Novosphingobium sediminicola TaxID=563162 RepID=A0A7W6G4R7_9SPHN|nr:glycosyltransferase [Novosphingobium sediminicola]MBB3953518.1 glycosyltransferase involved in cell wall biosynthesis [Novosphingobium sediminicola]